MNEIIFGEAEDIISDYVDQSSVFFKNIADPKPKVNLETSNFLPPYLIKLKELKKDFIITVLDLAERVEKADV